MRARGVSLSCFTARSLAISTAAPSQIWLELPAVMRPPAVRMAPTMQASVMATSENTQGRVATIVELSFAARRRESQ
jgi:hypothetical protein